jgi:four helix bundle suffix protein
MERLKDMVGAGLRFTLGLPRADNATDLWIQLFYSALNVRGCARAVDVMVAVGPSMFSTVTLPFRQACIVYECTVQFCERFREKLDRTVDQMIQAARTGKQNLLEGCMDSSKALFVRRIGARSEVSYESSRTYLDTRSSEIVAHILICLIHQTNYLLDQQLRALETAFLTKGGLRKRMTRARLDARRQQSQGAT